MAWSRLHINMHHIKVKDAGGSGERASAAAGWAFNTYHTAHCIAVNGGAHMYAPQVVTTFLLSDSERVPEAFALKMF